MDWLDKLPFELQSLCSFSGKRPQALAELGCVECPFQAEASVTLGGWNRALRRASEVFISAWVNGVSSLFFFFGKGAESRPPFPNIVTSTTCRQCPQLPGTVYRLQIAMRTQVNNVSGLFLGKGAFGPLRKHCHFVSTIC